VLINIKRCKLNMYKETQVKAFGRPMVGITIPEVNDVRSDTFLVAFSCATFFHVTSPNVATMYVNNEIIQVPMGRGGFVNSHPGHRQYMKMVQDKKLEYVSCKNSHKIKVSNEQANTSTYIITWFVPEAHPPDIPRIKNK
jgi:hypothetical protein